MATKKEMLLLVVIWNLGAIGSAYQMPAAYCHRRDGMKLWARQETTFGMGCFWKPAEELLKTEGVIDTVVGYTGNADVTEPPSYSQVCYSRDWVEGVRVYYDDDKISYRDLLEAFFEAQEPKPSRQYASIIFPHNEEQKQVAKEWLTSEAERRRSDGIPVKLTQLEPLTAFYRAEGYHQQYWAKQRPRFALIGLLVLVSTGVVDSYIPKGYQIFLDRITNGFILALALYVLAERLLDSKVVELQ
jgi:methionine-S-sulfoxide reductase